MTIPFLQVVEAMVLSLLDICRRGFQEVAKLYDPYEQLKVLV